MITQNFARTGTDAFITGVAFQDLDGDRFYDIGEGRSGVVVDWLGNTGGAVASASAGGFAVGLPTGLGGWARVSIDAGSGAMQASLGMTGTNVKLDVINGTTLAASTDLALGSGARNGVLLGVTGTDLIGNAAGNGLTGNGGANVLKGMLGNDTIRGGGGADWIVGGAGSDALDGGAGPDDFVFTATGDSAPLARDSIWGFARGSDDIVVSNIDANAGITGNQAFELDAGGAFSAGEVRQTATTSGLLLQFNTDGDTAAEMAVLIRGVALPLSASDFLL